MNKTVGIIGGVALVGVLGYMIYSKNKAATPQSPQAPSGSDADSKTSKSNDGGSSAEQAPAPITLKNKKITKVDDLKGTPLGTFLSVELVSEDGKAKMNEVISAFSPAEKTVLEYAALATDEERTSAEYNSALNAKFGSKAAALKDKVVSRLVSASGFKKIETGGKGGTTAVGNIIDRVAGLFGSKVENKVEAAQENRRERKACRKAAQEACGRKLRDRKCRRDFRKKCLEEGGYDEGGEDFASFSSSRLTSEQEDFAFNGHTF